MTLNLKATRRILEPNKLLPAILSKLVLSSKGRYSSPLLELPGSPRQDRRLLLEYNSRKVREGKSPAFAGQYISYEL
jgi:hypothetical protein